MGQTQPEYDGASRDLLARLEALLEVSRAATASRDLAEVASLVVERSVQAIGVHAAALLVADPRTGSAIVAKAHGLSADFLSDFILAPGVGVAGTALREGRPFWTEDIHADLRFPLPEHRRSRLEAEGIRAVLAVPIRTPQGPSGVLTLYRRDAWTFDPDQVRFATLLADQAGNAVESARVHQQRLTQILALSEALRKLVIAQPIDRFFRDLVEMARQAAGARYGALGVLGADGRMAELVAAGLTPEETEQIGALPQGRGLLGHMLKVTHPVRLEDLGRHPQSAGFPPHHPPMRSFLGVRIVFQDQVIGALYLTEKQGGTAFTEEDERLVEAFAANAAVAITNARAYREAQEARRELEEKTKELEAFTYTVSHDLKAPLRGIDGFSRALQEEYGDRLDAEGRRYLEIVRAAARRMDQLIEDLLKYSRLERGAIRRGRVDLAALCDRILEDHRTQLEARQLTIRLQWAVPEVEADPQGLREAIANLVDNAIKFSKPGASITVSSAIVDGLPVTGIRAEAGAIGGSGPTGEGRHVVVSVQDEGIGFDMQYHNRIFEIFQRLHRPAEYEGTGVGLAIVKKVAERHGGRAWAQSAPGGGSTFYLALPG